MKLLGVAVALFGFLVWRRRPSNLAIRRSTFSAAASLIVAYCCWRSAPVSRFLKIFLALFAVETIVFGLADFAARFGYWPKSLAEARMPPTLALTVAMFAIIVFAVSHIPVVRALTRIADRFFLARMRPAPGSAASASRRWSAAWRPAWSSSWSCSTRREVAITVRLNFFNRDFFNAIQNHDGPEFWRMLIWVFTPWAFIYVGALVVEYVVSSYLVIRWRRWLTQFYISHWLSRHAHYRMSLASGPTDNPDQRIAEDVARFIDGGGDGGAFGYGVYNYSIMLISTLSSLVSFALLLWSLSANYTFPGTNFAFPGLLFWVALIYAAAGTLVTHLIGRPLVEIMFTRQKVEADFRFRAGASARI